MEDKYALFDPMCRCEDNGDVIILQQVLALRDFGDVKKGDIGGYIEKEENLSHEGDCWVYPNSYVSGNARIENNAKIYDSVVKDNAIVRDNAKVYNSIICDNAEVLKNVSVCGHGTIAKDAYIDKSNDVICISPVGPIKNMTFYTDKDDNIIVHCSDLELIGPVEEIEDILINKSDFSNNKLYTDAIICAISFAISVLHHTKVKTTITRDYEEYIKKGE